MLVSWKEIASFLDRAERTVKRWERERGLPVHRVPGGERGSVYAYAAELEDWLRGKADELEADDPAPKGPVEPVAVLPAGPQAESVPASPAAPLAARRRTITLARLAAWLGPLAITGALVYYLSGGHTNTGVTAVGDHESSSTSAPSLEVNSVAVLPFTNGGGAPGSEYLPDGITESLIGNLARIPQLKVRSRDSVFRLKGKDLQVQEAGSELGVSIVVSGRVMERADNIQISTELTDIHNNSEIWGRQYTGKTSDLIHLQEQIAGDVAKKLRSTISPADSQRVTRQGTQNPEAYDLYLKGRYTWYQRTPANLQAAISYFNQAIVKDPGYALAYSGLADAYSVLPNFSGNPDEDFPKSATAARRALELDPTLAHPHAVLGANLIEFNWDFAGGEAEFKKAIALDPNDATAHQWFAEKIGQLGRHQEALAEINIAHDLDPLSPVIIRVKAGTLADAGQFDQAIEICKHLVQESPTSPLGHDCLYEAYWGKRMYPQSVDEWIKKSRLYDTPIERSVADAVESGYHSGGWNRALIGAAAAMEAHRKGGYASPFDIARCYAAAGDKDKAFRWLDVAIRERDPLLLGLYTAPGYDSIRSDPRFAEIVRKVGLPRQQ